MKPCEKTLHDTSVRSVEDKLVDLDPYVHKEALPCDEYSTAKAQDGYEAKIPLRGCEMEIKFKSRDTPQTFKTGTLPSRAMSFSSFICLRPISLNSIEGF